MMNYKLIRIFLCVILANGISNANAQMPQKLSYQAVIRDRENNLIVDSPVGIRITILQEMYNGVAVYTETHLVNTNANGLVSLEIGGGLVECGQFDKINWAEGPYFLKSEVDPSGGFNCFIIGTHEILSVPYALHANTADSIKGLQSLINSVVEKHPSVKITAQDIENWNLKADSIRGTELVFDGWDNNAADDFSGDYADLRNTPKNLSDFNNDTKYIGAETDPVYSNSVAAGITSSDTALWNAKSAESDPVFAAWNRSTGISITQSQIADLDVFEKELITNETSIDTGFLLLSTSNIYINGTVLSAAQWSGIGTTTIVLKLDIELFDKLKIER